MCHKAKELFMKNIFLSPLMLLALMLMHVYSCFPGKKEVL